MSIIISLGSACVVKHNIDRFSGHKETNFFDWLVTNFKTVTTILKDIDNRWFLSKDKFVQNGVWSDVDETKHIMDNTDIFMRSKHDVSICNDYDSELYNFIEKYNRRLDRLKTYINGDKTIHMIHCLGYQYNGDEYVVTQEDINNFHNYINNINPNIKCFLHIAVPPKYNVNLNHLKLYKTFIYYLNDKYQVPHDWKSENYNWDIIFDNIKRIDCKVINRNNILNNRRQQMVNYRRQQIINNMQKKNIDMRNSSNKKTLNNLKFT